MNNLNELYNIAKQNEISVYCFSLPKTVSISVQDKQGAYSIGIDPMMLSSETQEREHLAHELGHCMTGALYSRRSPFELVAKHEWRANAWCIEKLVPRDMLESKVRQGYRELWELAEQFDVSEGLIKKAVQYYRQKHGE